MAASGAALLRQLESLEDTVSALNRQLHDEQLARAEAVALLWQKLQGSTGTGTDAAVEDSLGPSSSTSAVTAARSQRPGAAGLSSSAAATAPGDELTARLDALNLEQRLQQVERLCHGTSMMAMHHAETTVQLNARIEATEQDLAAVLQLQTEASVSAVPMAHDESSCEAQARGDKGINEHASLMAMKAMAMEMEAKLKLQLAQINRDFGVRISSLERGGTEQRQGSVTFPAGTAPRALIVRRTSATAGINRLRSSSSDGPRQVRASGSVRIRSISCERNPALGSAVMRSNSQPGPSHAIVTVLTASSSAVPSLLGSAAVSTLAPTSSPVIARRAVLQPSSSTATPAVATPAGGSTAVSREVSPLNTSRPAHVVAAPPVSAVSILRSHALVPPCAVVAGPTPSSPLLPSRGVGSPQISSRVTWTPSTTARAVMEPACRELTASPNSPLLPHRSPQINSRVTWTPSSCSGAMPSRAGAVAAEARAPPFTQQGPPHRWRSSGVMAAAAGGSTSATAAAGSPRFIARVVASAPAVAPTAVALQMAGAGPYQSEAVLGSPLLSGRRVSLGGALPVAGPPRSSRRPQMATVPSCGTLPAASFG
mmetsp:Transcript_56112/g.182061  ORF Transcript_56112/g.182061 Transcript_56112/m.182061 type:complete len:598 (-) Transcript_56112:413-2206(-)